MTSRLCAPGCARIVFLMLLVLIAWTGQRADAADAYLFSFSGQVDGSDTITITGNQAQWQHSYWGYPTGVTLNGQAWQPQSTPTLTLASPALPALSGYTVRVQRLAGRDVQTAQIEGNSLVMKFADTPNGSDHYEFQCRPDSGGGRPRLHARFAARHRNDRWKRQADHLTHGSNLPAAHFVLRLQWGVEMFVGSYVSLSRT